MFRRLLLWTVFAACLAVVLAAMGWISLAAVRLERAEAEARRQALVEERTRLALWRMDSSLAPLLAQESVRSSAAYQAFLPTEFLDRSSAKGPPKAALWTPSPLLVDPPPEVLLYFEIGPDGAITSPQVPAERFRGLLARGRIDPERIAKAAKLLGQWRAVADRGRLLALLPPQPAAAEAVAILNPSAQPQTANRLQDSGVQQAVSDNDFNLRNNMRSQVVQGSRNQLAQTMAPPQGPAEVRETPATAADGGAPMTPLWLGGRLLLARRITTAGREYVQGCLLDWPAVKKSLLASIADLLPHADLKPMPDAPAASGSRMLAALPVELVPGGIVEALGGGASPILLSLGIAWACVLTAAAAVAALLWGVMRLSGRRAAFVSAVTHELRTPLTTFRLYAEMLSEGMVPDAQRQREYLVSLRREADRLAHLVENVLSYARLERGRGRALSRPSHSAN